MKAGASRTEPKLQHPGPHAIALAPAAQPRPATPGQALPAMPDQRGVNFGRRSGVNIPSRLTVCPNCGCTTCNDCRRGESPRWRCKARGADFSVTSGTLFAWRKLPLKTYLMAIVAFCNEVKGKSMLALSRDLGVQCKTAFVLAHKPREAMASAMRGLTIGGEGGGVGYIFQGYASTERQ